MATMEEEEVDRVKVLERLRMDLQQVAKALSNTSMRLQANGAAPPSWPDLHRDAELAHRTLQTYQTDIATHHSYLKSLHAYPTTSFPGHEKENILQTLLRKKLDPAAESWVTEYAKPAHTTGEDFRDLWSHASTKSQEILMRFADSFGSEFTLEEKEAGTEGVVTGLKRKLQDSGIDEESDDEEGDEHMEGEEETRAKPATGGGDGIGGGKVEPPMPLEALLRFVTTGMLPPANR